MGRTDWFLCFLFFPYLALLGHHFANQNERDKLAVESSEIGAKTLTQDKEDNKHEQDKQDEDKEDNSGEQINK